MTAGEPPASPTPTQTRRGGPEPEGRADRTDEYADHAECTRECPHDDPQGRRCHCPCPDCHSPEWDCRCTYCKLLSPHDVEDSGLGHE